MKTHYDIVIIGGGIVGISSAWQLKQAHPDARILVVDKEGAPAQHQTGRNSGVIHAGVYYAPGSLKARFCREGNAATVAFCEEHAIPYERCGKLLVATDNNEMARMGELETRCHDNGIEVERLSQSDLRAREPNVSGVGALFVPSTGIVNYGEITRKMADLFMQADGHIRYNTQVRHIIEVNESVHLDTTRGEITCSFLLSCAGAHSDEIVRMLGLDSEFRIIPFRGEYYQLPPSYNHAFNHLIYPIPDPGLPFLGVHLTKMIDGSITVGPNAVLAGGREAYRRSDFNLHDLWSMFTYPGLYKLLGKHFRSSLGELRNSISRKSYLKLVHKYAPQVQLHELRAYPAGIRAQALRKDGSMVDDFLFTHTRRALVVCNAPSPAATSAIPIGRHIVEKLNEQMAALD